MESNEWIRECVDTILLGADEQLEWLLPVVRQFRFVPLAIGWVATLGIDESGQIVRWTEATNKITLEENGFYRRHAIKYGSRKYPDLLPLVPPPPINALVCPICSGSGSSPFRPETVVCRCGGLGWVIPGEVQGPAI